MATVRHAFESDAADPADTSKIGKTKWHDPHDLESLAELDAVNVFTELMTVEQDDPAQLVWVLKSDNQDGNGMLIRSSLENNPTGPSDWNFRNVVFNIGSTVTTGPGAQKYGSVQFAFLSPAGTNGAYLQTLAPGEEVSGGARAWTLGVNGDMTSYVGGLASNAWHVMTYGEANARFRVSEMGALSWGAGGASALDTTLYRVVADTLKTDDSFIVGGTLYSAYLVNIANTGTYMDVSTASGGISLINRSNVANVPLVVRGMASQSGSLQQWQNSGQGVLASVSAAGAITATDGMTGKYKEGAGVTNLADSDFTVTPANGATGVAHNTTDGKSYYCVRANGTWKSVEVA